MFGKIISRALPFFPKRLVHSVAKRYIAGEQMMQAIELARSLRNDGYLTTIDILGEDITHTNQGNQQLVQYLQLMDAMSQADLNRNISIKLSQLGLRLDTPQTQVRVNTLIDKARTGDFFIRFDMEDASVTDITLDIAQKAHQKWLKSGTVLQARLKRTPDDARRLAGPNVNVRLCKGIYLEPKSIAYQRKERINDAFLRALSILLERQTRVGVATHDKVLIQRVLELLDSHSTYAPLVEFQALLGVPVKQTLESLKAMGYPVRLYIPYGPQWYAYSMRRLRENPHMASAIARSLLFA